MKTKLTIMLAILALTCWATAASADLIFTGSSGSLSAEADFKLTGNTLTITLTNTSKADVLVPTDVLTGLDFNTTHTLTPVSASLNGSTVEYGTISNVGNGWGYASSVSAQTKNSAISASGAVSKPGHANFGNTANALNGFDYGIVSAGDDPSTGNSGLKKHGPLVKNSIVFTLTAAPGFSLDELGNSVVFQFGSELNEPHFTGYDPPVPLPPSALLLGSGLLGLWALGYRRKWGC